MLFPSSHVAWSGLCDQHLPREANLFRKFIDSNLVFSMAEAHLLIALKIKVKTLYWHLKLTVEISPSRELLSSPFQSLWCLEDKDKQDIQDSI